MAVMPFEGQRQTKTIKRPHAMSKSIPSSLHWRRALRPFLWWGIMVLLMFAYRAHQNWSARTCVFLNPTLKGNQVWADATAALDGEEFGLFPSQGQKVSIGWHSLRITHPKAKPYLTNLFIWYGVNDLGQIALERATGILLVSANPPAPRIEIRGPEFSMTLTNTPGITSSVPTDAYVIEALYKYWQRRDEVTVFADQGVTPSFAPRMGTLEITASHSDAVYQLLGEKERWIDAGRLPATINGLPEGKYRLRSTRKADQREMPVLVKAGATNAIQVEFLYGAAVIESDPPGAAVRSGGNELGIAPLSLPELKPGAFDFVLQKDGFESVASSLTIIAYQTNGFRTNLVSQHYTSAIARARFLYSEKNFASAAEAATEALKHKAGDEAAIQMLRSAKGRTHLERAEQSGSRGDYAAAIKDANAALESLPDSEYAKTLLADLTKRENERIEAEKKRQAELAEQERRKREAELAAQMRQQRLNRLSTMFYELNRSYNNAAQFSRHELATTNTAASVATAINNTLGGGQPSFELVSYEWPQAGYFKIQSRHRIGIGYRECLIVGAQVADGETQIFWKVFEYEQLPDLKLLNGFMTISGSFKMTSQDPKVEQKKAERFQERIKEGIKIVRERIQNASFGP
jgi:tetratricopeptide (TPR) repeat protein